MTLPTTMRAVEISEPGGPPEVLRPVDVPVPTPPGPPGDILIKVAFAGGVNRPPDALQRAGSYAPPPPPTASPLPGLEARVRWSRWARA